MSENTQSSANTDPQLLLESGPMLLRDFNPKGVLRFQGRKCLTCNAEIMDHWLRPNDDPDLRTEYWCTKDGDTYSAGLAETRWDVPPEMLARMAQANELVSTNTDKILVCQHTNMSTMSMQCVDCGMARKDIV